jgi:hypothetical protein
MSWNIGNTTVRNPARIQAGLQLLASEFSGNLHGPVQEAYFWDRLTEAGIVKSQPKKEPALDGRKWRSCFCKLGFITDKDYSGIGEQKITLADLQRSGLDITGKPYEITPIGRRLAEATTLAAIEDIFFRQLLRLEIPSPTENEKRDKIKPLVLVLQVLYGLHQSGADGLNKSETAIFLQTATHHQGIQVRVKRILEHREAREQIQGKVKKRAFDRTTLENQRQSHHPRPDSLLDYADTTFRYCRLPGLLTLQGSRLVIRPEKMGIVERVLEHEPDFITDSDPLDYLIDFYTGTRIPTDDAAVAQQQIEQYEAELQRYGVVPIVQSSQTTDTQTLQGQRYELEAQFRLVKEQQFADLHASDKHIIDDIITYLQAVTERNPDSELGIDDKSAYLEWVVWRALLTLNHLELPPHQTRHFEMDGDLRPVGNAPSRRADIVMSYRDFRLVTEVTLLESSRQYAAEGEPVIRHVYDVMKSHPDTKVYGLFIAPKIEINTLDHFQTGTWIDPNFPDEKVKVNVVPLTIKQLIHCLRQIEPGRHTPDDLRQMLDACLDGRESRKPAEWQAYIDHTVRSWWSSP